MLVGENGNPPVVKVQDYNKLMYEQKKKKKEQKKKAKQQDLKEVQFKARIDENDLNVKVNRINEFLTKGNKVKLVVRLRGRERQVPQIGEDLLKRVVEKVEVDHKITTPKSPMPMMILEPVS